MELQGLGSINLPIKNTGLQPGQRFLVEVIQKDPSGKAQIRLGGQVIPAMLEISVEPGGKFWASIHKIDENGIVLVRDNSNYPGKDMPIDSQRLERLYLEFASPKGKSLANLLSAVLTDSKGAQVPADGKGTTVVTDGKGAPVVTDGKGTPVVTDGKGTPVVTDGKGTPVVTDGKGAPVVTDGKGAPVVTDGKGAPVVTDGKGAPVVTDGKGAPVVTDGKGAPVMTDGKGAPVVTDGKGAPIVTDGKGAPVVTDGKGAPVVTDGKGAPVVTDGKGAPVVTDGKGAPVVTDGKGAPVVTDGKGAPVVTDGKGAPVVTDGKGAPVVTDGKGAPVVTDGKGAPVVTDGKGAPVVTDGKGAPVVADSKGVPVVTDSKSTFVPIDGKNASVPTDVKGTPVAIDGKGLQSNTGIQNVFNEELFNLSGKEMIASFINNNVPQWSNLGTDGFLQLFMLFKGLGLDYERRLKNIETMKDGDIQNLQIELKKSLKGIILSLLNSSESTGNEKSLFSSLLERITGQQILLQAGNPDAPFYLMEIPLQSEGELYTQTLAFKASRKGKKIDLDHCRLALHAETPTLGELGLEGWLYEGQLTLKLLSENQERLQTLIEENYESTRTIFHQMGITLHPIGVGQLRTAEEFHRFLKGELREGVNYQV